MSKEEERSEEEERRRNFHDDINTKSEEERRDTFHGDIKMKSKEEERRKGGQKDEGKEEEEEEEIILKITLYDKEARGKYTTREEEEINTWILDSGCTSHYVISKYLLHNITPLHTSHTVKTADGNKLSITHMGMSYIKGDRGEIWELPDVKYVPGFTHNLISVSKLTSNTGVEVLHTEDKAYIIYNKIKVITALKQNNLYYIPIHTIHQQQQYTSTAMMGRERERRGK